MQSDHRTEVKSPEENENSSNKRIAKNAVMLYLRMFLSMIVGFYTSRVVLDTLGVEDYGIYGVVGGVVAMVGFLNASMSGATSRFLTFELGRGNPKRLAKTFSSALIVHVGIALIVFVFAETVGLWFLANKLVIPPERMGAAHWVYQLSIVSTMLGITQVPYNATIIAHEKMDVYAYVEILSVTLKLLIVYLLTIGNFDKLILYATLVFAVGVLILIIYRLYCIRHFPESHFHWVWDKTILKPLLSFSGWDLYGNGCVTVRQQGVNFLINMFFGVAYNAASSLATTVNGLIKGLVSNVTQAFRPVVIKNYAAGQFEEMQNNMNNAMKYMLLMFGCMFTPFYLEMRFLFNLWLIRVPEYAVSFCRFLLIASIFSMINNIVTILIHATGKIKMLSFATGSFYLLSIPIIYLFFKLRFPVEYAYVVSIFANMIILCSNLIIAKKLVNELNLKSLLYSIAVPFFLILLASCPTIYLFLVLETSVFRFLIITIIHMSILGLLAVAFCIDKTTRSNLLNWICHRFL